MKMLTKLQEEAMEVDYDDPYLKLDFPCAPALPPPCISVTKRGVRLRRRPAATPEPPCGSAQRLWQRRRPQAKLGDGGGVPGISMLWAPRRALPRAHPPPDRPGAAPPSPRTPAPD